MTALLIWLTPLPLVNAAVIGVVTTVLLERGGLFGRRGEPQGKPPPIVNESSLYPKQALSS
jgi:hypothetical protein